MLTIDERLARAERDATIFDATVSKLGGKKYASPEPRLMTRDLQELLRRPDPNRGFTFLVVFPDRKGKSAQCLGTQDGRFWPALPSSDQGMGTKARNEWAARFAQATYENIKNNRETP